MEIKDPTALALICDTLRAKGVTEFTVGDITVKLGPMPDTTPAAAPTPIPMCGCGHHDWAHGPDGTCINGCDVEKCAPEARA